MDLLEARVAVLRLSREGDISGVVRVLREHASLAAVQSLGLQELATLVPAPGAHVQTAEVTAALQAGALQVAVDALQTHSANAAVQFQACVVLAHLAHGFAAEVGASGAIEAAVAAMLRHSADVDVQERACFLLHCLTTGPVATEDVVLHETRRATAHLNARRAGDAGAVEALLAALYAHGSSLHWKGIRALYDLVRVRENALRALHAGVLELYVAILRAASLMPNEVTLNEVFYLLGALSNIVEADAATIGARAGELGTADAVVFMLRRHAQSSEIQFMGCSMLLLLVKSHAPNLGRMWRAGALPVVENAAKVEGKLQEKTQEAASALVEQLLGFEANALAAANAAAEELLASEAAGAQAPPRKPNKKKKHRRRGNSTRAEAAGAAEEDETPLEAVQQPGGASSCAAAGNSAQGVVQGPECVICLDALPCVVLLPCRHMPVCGSCAARLEGKCPLCRATVADTITVIPH